VIYLSNSVRRLRVDERALARAARRLLTAAGAGNASLSIALVGDRAIRRLNQRHRGKDRATDVLSFGGSAGPEPLLGDVVISLDRASRQAAAYGATLDSEIRRLLIHGIAHLRGHDHQTAAERARMLRLERKMARAIGMRWPY
jgi:probable rRNA maturation factor